MKKFITYAVAVLTFILCSSSAFASTGSKNVNIHYNNIQLIVNGRAVNTSAEPFILNGVTYVPLRDISTALNAEVEWDGTNNTIIINFVEDENSSEDSNINIIETDNNEMNEQLDNTDDSKTSQLANLLLEEHGILKGVYFQEFKLTGDKKEINLDIILNLDENIEAWSALRDKEIEDWLKLIAEDVQKSYDEDTLVKGKIIRNENKDVLLDFDKDGDDDLKVRFYDGNYRTGVAVRTKLSIEKEYAGKHFFVKGIDFMVTSVNYRKEHKTVDVIMNAVDSNVIFDWDKLSTRDIKHAVRDIGYTVAEDFANNANISLEKVNLTFKDKRNKGLGFYIYDVEEGKVK